MKERNIYKEMFYILAGVVIVMGMLMLIEEIKERSRLREMEMNKPVEIVSKPTSIVSFENKRERFYMS